MADAPPYGFVIVHEPMANEGLHLARGIELTSHYHGPGLPNTPAAWPSQDQAEVVAERARARFPESRFVVCMLVPVEAGIQQSFDVVETRPL